MMIMHYKKEQNLSIYSTQTLMAAQMSGCRLLMRKWSENATGGELHRSKTGAPRTQMLVIAVTFLWRIAFW
jgi:hypothetical protein